MSLTSRLAKDGPVRRFFEDHFTVMERPRDDWKNATVGVERLPVRPGGLRANTVGTAFDYRLRLAFEEDVDPGRFLAAVVAQKLSTHATFDGPVVAGPRGPYYVTERLTIMERPRMASKPPESYLPSSPGATVGGLLPEYFRLLQHDLARIRPAVTLPSQEDEDLLDRHCCVLALLDELYRAGYRINSALYRLPRGSSVNDLLSLGAGASDDLSALFGLFWKNHRHLLALPTITNPTFASSIAVGGADADLIVDGALLEIKTINNEKWDKRWVWQLIGYLLLDWDDQYSIRRLGVYSGRHGALVTWDVDELLGSVFPDRHSSLSDLREEFRELLTSPDNPA